MSRDDDIKEFSVVEHSRATPLRPAIWMTGVLVWATVIALLFHVPTWAGIFLCGITGLSFLFYLASYSYLMLIDREALRRERLKTRGRQMLERGSANNRVIDTSTPRATLETHSLVTEKVVVNRKDD